MNERRPDPRTHGLPKPTRRVLTAFASVLIVSAAAAGCSSVSVSDGGRQTAKIDPKLGVAPSPRVVAFGEKVPKGGGKAMVGEPYKVAGKRYVPKLDPDYEKVGYASWYGNAFHGRRTANGEVFDSEHLSAAHPTMPLPSYARVTSVDTGRSVIVRVNDRGPFHSNRLIDISRRAADMLGVRAAGIAKVKVEYVGPAPTEGDDTEFLVASYRGPSVSPSLPETMIASAEALPGVALKATTSVASAAAGLFTGNDGDDAPVVSTTMVASADEAAPVGPMVPGDVLPPNRPGVTEAYVVVAAVDPADVFLSSGTMLASAPLPAVQPVGYTPEPAPAPNGPALGNVPLPPLPPVVRQSYAEERVNVAYAAVEEVGQGVALSDLVARLETMASRPKPPEGAVLQLGLFADPANAERLAAAIEGIGDVLVDEVEVNGRSLKRVRVASLALAVEEAVAAAERAGAKGVQILR